MHIDGWYKLVTPNFNDGKSVNIYKLGLTHIALELHPDAFETAKLWSLSEKIVQQLLCTQRIEMKNRLTYLTPVFRDLKRLARHQKI